MGLIIDTFYMEVVETEIYKTTSYLSNHIHVMQDTIYNIYLALLILIWKFIAT